MKGIAACGRDGAGFQPFFIGVSVTWGVAPGWYGAAPLALSEMADVVGEIPVRIGHTRQTCGFQFTSARLTARAGVGTLAAVSAHAVKESQADLRFMMNVVGLSKNVFW